MLAPLFDWRRVLVYTHRWLGILGGLLFLAWFVSGIVLMYAGMPTLLPNERFERLPPLDLSGARSTPAEAAGRYGLSPNRVRIATLYGRPVYRFVERGLPVTVFADDGERLEPLTEDDAMTVAARWAPEQAGSLRYQARLVAPDQWTLQSQQFMPLHKVSLGDTDGTHLYVSDRTGEPVMKTTRSTRGVAYVGAVLHWLYFTPLRRHGAFWVQSVIWLSIIGCVLCLSGLVWGVWRWSPGRRFRLRAGDQQTPYAGLMRWHHYAGLIFGLTTFTWTLSGGLSLDPWNWHPPNSASAEQPSAVSGGPLQLNLVTIDGMLRGLSALRDADATRLKELELAQFQGEPFLMASDAPAMNTVGSDGRLSTPPVDRVVSAVSPEKGAFSSFDRDRIVEAARKAMPTVDLVDTTWLEEYDSYYYGRPGTRPLPVLRARFDDSQQTWLYLDPRRGEIVLKEERLTRLNRWLYHGLHSLDFPFLYNRRPLWDAVVIALSLGGIVLSASTLAQSWRRLRRHGRRLIRGWRSPAPGSQ